MDATPDPTIHDPAEPDGSGEGRLQPVPRSGAGGIDPVDPFQALGDANRQQIIEFLAEVPHSVQELADRMSISRPAISRHLRLLKEAGLVRVTPEGTRRIYRLDERGADVIEDWLHQVWGNALGRFRLLAENITSEAGSDQEVADRRPDRPSPHDSPASRRGGTAS